MTLPQTLLDLQFDSLVLPMDAKVAQKFDYKFKQYSIIKIDAQELLDILHNFTGFAPRTVIFVRPFNSQQPPDIYQRALRAMIYHNLPHIQITDVVFDEVLTGCIRQYNYYNESSAELQHLDKKLIENHFYYLIQPTLQLPNFYLNASVNTFVLAVYDSAHKYAPRYSDYLKTTTKPVYMHQIVPVQFFQSTSFYSPVQLLPPMSDDPANPYFYINDCKYMYNYRDYPSAVPCPRLIINGFGLLPAEEGIMKKNEDLVRTAQDLAYVYASLENGYYLAAHALCGVLYQNIGHLYYLIKLMQEYLYIVKSGKIDYRKEDFFVNLATGSKFYLVQNLDQFEEPYLDIKEIFRGEQAQFKSFVKQTVNIYHSALDAITNGYFPEVMNLQVKKRSISRLEIEYLRKAMSIDAVGLEFACFTFLQKIAQNGEMDPRIMLDWDEFGAVLATNLRIIIFKCLLSGFFNRKLTRNTALYDAMKDAHLQYNSPLSKMRMDIKEFNQMFLGTSAKCPRENKALPISLFTISVVFYALNDPIVIRPQNQPDIRDSVVVIYKNGRNFLSSDYIQMYCYLLRISKKLKDRDPPALSTKQCINYYIPATSNQFDGQYEAPETPEERIKYSKLAEDVTNGKCAICYNTSYCMYNNYREHIQSYFHRERYKQQLEGIYETLVRESHDTAQVCARRQQMSVLCYLLAQRTGESFSVCVRHVNAVLTDLRLFSLLVDVDEEPRSNSPTCRTEQFGKWREYVLRQRFEYYEARLAGDEQNSGFFAAADNVAAANDTDSANGTSGSVRARSTDESNVATMNTVTDSAVKGTDEYRQKLDSAIIACAWHIYRAGTDSGILYNALLNLIREYGSPDDVLAVEDLVHYKVSDNFAVLSDVQKAQFTGANDVIDHRDLYAELINRVAQSEEAEEEQHLTEEQEYVESFPALSKDQFDVFQDYTYHYLNLLLAPYEELQFEKLFFKTVEELEKQQQDEVPKNNTRYYYQKPAFMTPKDIKDLRRSIAKYENGVPHNSAPFKSLLQNISFVNNSSLSSILSKEHKMAFCSGKLYLPPFYKENPDFVDNTKLLYIAEHLRSDKEDGITLYQFLRTCREYSSDLALMLDFVQNNIHFNYETEDDINIKYSSFSPEFVQYKYKYEQIGLLERFKAKFEIPNAYLSETVTLYPRLLHSNSFDGLIDDYCVTSLTMSESTSLNRLLTTDLPRDDLNWPYQVRETSDDNDFSVSLTQIQNNPAPPVHTFETSKDCWNDIIRGFDFQGDVPTLQNVSTYALEAVAALVQTQTGFSHISEVADFAYDGAVCSCLAGSENLDVIYGCSAARMSSSSYKQYEEVQSGSFTVQRRVVGAGLFG